MLPNPIRFTVRSPPSVMVPAAAAGMYIVFEVVMSNLSIAIA
jgi:hypothetical protein